MNKFKDETSSQLLCNYVLGIEHPDTEAIGEELKSRGIDAEAYYDKIDTALIRIAKRAVAKKIVTIHPKETTDA